MKVPHALQRTSQRGLGLVETMIALTIGIVLLLGVSQYFMSMRQTSQSAQQLSALQNQQRMAMYFLHVAVAGAGYNPDPINQTAVSLYPAVNGTFSAGQALSGVVVGSNDTLSARFTASTVATEQGCSASLTPGDSYTDVFSVANGFLVCTETDNTAPGAAATTQKLISGVSGMTILYGVDAQNSGSVSQYLTAALVTSGSLWGNVKTVQVTLLFTDPLAGQPGHGANSNLGTLIETIPYMANI